MWVANIDGDIFGPFETKDEAENYCKATQNSLKEKRFEMASKAVMTPARPFVPVWVDDVPKQCRCGKKIVSVFFSQGKTIFCSGCAKDKVCHKWRKDKETGTFQRVK